MKKYINGRVVDCGYTADEMTDMQSEYRKDVLRQQYLPMTEHEASMLVISAQINKLAVDDNTAIRMKDFYPTFESVVGQTVSKGFKFSHGDKLWSVVQPELTIQAHYPPGAGMESLYAEVCETHDGTLDDPIPYNGNMVLVAGRYYHQNFEIYKCTRDTVNPVYNDLLDLVGLYVEIV